jgi:hypothetical protein
MLSFNQFINESREEERKGKEFQFSNINAGDLVRYHGSRYEVEKVLPTIIHLKKGPKFNKHQWDTRNGEILKKAEDNGK